jgi:hypothetical protein
MPTLFLRIRGAELIVRVLAHLTDVAAHLEAPCGTSSRRVEVKG